MIEVPFDPNLNSIVFSIGLKDRVLEHYAVKKICGNREYAHLVGKYKNRLERSYQVACAHIDNLSVFYEFLRETGQKEILRVKSGKVCRCFAEHNYYCDQLSTTCGTLVEMSREELAGDDFTWCVTTHKYYGIKHD